MARGRGGERIAAQSCNLLCCGFAIRKTRRVPTALLAVTRPCRIQFGDTAECNSALFRRAGFTIIEIMTAMIIFCLIVAAIFQCYTAITNGSVAGSRAAISAQRSRVALSSIEEALGATRSFVADSQYYTFDAENGTEPYLSFVSRLSPSFPRSGRFKGFNPETGIVTDFDVRRLTFAVEAAPDWGKRLVLRQSPVLMDMDEDEQNYPVVLANDVRKFEMEFWDKKKSDWLDEWTETNQLPQMVKFTVQFGGGDPNSPAGDEITRIVALPSISVAPNWQAPGMALPTGGGQGLSTLPH